MKILVANPNSSKAVTEVVERSAKRQIKNPNTEIITICNYRGTHSIDSTFADYQSSWSLIRQIIKRTGEEKIDAVVLAGFGNVGIFALKEALDIPVLSISETSQAIACLMGHKYTILTTMKQSIPLTEDLVRLYRFEGKCASVRAIGINVQRCVTHKEETLNELKDAILKIVEEDGAEVVILGSGGLCGYDIELQELVKLPVLDPVTVTTKVAEMMVETGLCHSKKRKFAKPSQEFSAYFWDGEKE